MSLSRRKKGLILGFGLMSAAALVAFGTSKYASAKKKRTEAAEEGGEHEGQPVREALEERSLWDRAKEVGQGIVLLFTNRHLRD